MENKKSLAEELEEINPFPNMRYKNKIPLCFDFEEERRFVDFILDGRGKVCKLYYNLKTKQYDFEPIQN